jgi:hypothetical protein
VSLVEPSDVDAVGSLNQPFPRVTPRYYFQDASDMLGFQSVLRGKHILHTLSVNRIESERGTEARAQHLKLWSDHDSGQVSVSFYGHEMEPKNHFEFPIVSFEQTVQYPTETGVQVNFRNVNTSPPKKKRLILGSIMGRTSSGSLYSNHTQSQRKCLYPFSQVHMLTSFSF